MDWWKVREELFDSVLLLVVFFTSNVDMLLHLLLVV
jgi:hypothetical protein